jgi:hypothetical protein
MPRPRNLVVAIGENIVSVQPVELKKFLKARANGDALAVLKTAKVLAGVNEMMVIGANIDVPNAIVLFNNLFPGETAVTTPTA